MFNLHKTFTTLLVALHFSVYLNVDTKVSILTLTRYNFKKLEQITPGAYRNKNKEKEA